MQFYSKAHHLLIRYLEHRSGLQRKLCINIYYLLLFALLSLPFYCLVLLLITVTICVLRRCGRMSDQRLFIKCTVKSAMYTCTLYVENLFGNVYLLICSKNHT